jgi:phytoene dehydrogenase-like protein
VTGGSQLDAVVVGSGPNGLAAAVELARNGASVLVLEDRDEIGGGARTSELTLPGFAHDVCSGAHPLGSLSPYLSTLPLARYGLEWVRARVSVAHPLDDQPAVIVGLSLEETARGLGVDERAYRRLLAPLVRNASALLSEALGPPVHIRWCWRASGCAAWSRHHAWRVPCSGVSVRARPSPDAPPTPSCHSRSRSPVPWV